MLQSLKEGIVPERFEQVKLPKHTCRKIGITKYKDLVTSLSKYAAVRLRYQPKDLVVYQVNEDHAVNICYSIYRRALEASGNIDLVHKYHIDCRMYDLAGIKQLSDYAKKKGEQFNERWRYIVDLQRLNDFLEPKDISDFYDDVKDWVTRKPVHTWDGDEDRWYEEFKRSVNTVVFRSGHMPGKIITVDHFLNNPDLWATSGSGYDPEARPDLRILDEKSNREVKPMRTKWATAWAMSKYKLKKLLFKHRKAYQRAVMKSEPAKVRAVIAGDLSLYLKMSYISTILDEWFRGRKDSTLWMSKKERLKLWESMAYDGTWRMPLDQAEFDKNVSLRQVNIVLDVFRTLLSSLSNETVNEIMEEIIFSVNNSIVFVGGKAIEVSNGILSGWRWTALIDTIVNLAEVDMAERYANLNNYQLKIRELNAQGDDDWFKLNSYSDGVALWLIYESFGLNVNPGKFFLSKTRDEYLRRVLDKDKITGYPARSVTALMFRNPVNEKETVGIERHRQTFMKWKLFAERLDSTMNNTWFFKQWVADSLNSDKNLTKDKLISWVNQSVMVGGLGYNRPVIKDSLVPESGQVVVDKLDISYEGYNEWVRFVSQYGVSEENAYSYCVNTLNLQNDVRLPKWVKYIYSEDTITTSIPVGVRTGVKGTVGVGKAVYKYCKANNIRWFESYIALKSVTHYQPYIWTTPESFKTYNDVPRLTSGAKMNRLEPKDEITIGVARLSDNPGLAFKNYNELDYIKKSKRWTHDYLKGRLKAKLSVIEGWGMDIIGGIGDELLSSCINTMMLTTRATMCLWNTLLMAIDASIPYILRNYRVRIIE